MKAMVKKLEAPLTALLLDLLHEHGPIFYP